MDTNPFHKPKDGEAAKPKDVDLKQSLAQRQWHRIRNHCTSISLFAEKTLEETIYEQIPSVERAPYQYRTFLGGFYLLILLALFVFLFVQGYLAAMKTIYLSPVGEETSSVKANCELIPVVNTGAFLATPQGYWEGSQDFLYSNAAFVLSMKGFAATYENYAKALNSIYDALLFYSEQSRKKDLAFSLLLWMSLSFSEPSNTQRFSLLGTPLQVFAREFLEANIGNDEHLCRISNKVSFDKNNGLMTVSYDYQQFVQDVNCSHIMNPNYFGYNYVTKPSHFDLKFDVRTIVTAVAVNLGIAVLDAMVRIPTMDQSVIQQGLRFDISNYYDPKYPGMDPIICVTSGGREPVCGMAVGKGAAMPFFHHLGANFSFPTRCDCDVLTQVDLADTQHPCHLFNFLTGFVFWNTLDPSPLLESRYNLSSESQQDYNSLSYTAAFFTSFIGQYSPLYQSELRKKAFQFCHTRSAGSCALMVISAYDLTPRGFTVSEHYFQLQKGACSASILPKREDWNKLITKPFAPLVQQYQKCHDDFLTILINQAGISIGNLQLLMPFCVLFILLIIQMYYMGVDLQQYWKAKKTSSAVRTADDDDDDHVENLLFQQHSKVEKQQALEAFATLLLLARDKRFDTDREEDQNAQKGGKDDADFDQEQAGLPGRKLSVHDKVKRQTMHIQSTHLMNRLVEELVDYYNAKEKDSKDDDVQVGPQRPSKANQVMPFHSKSDELVAPSKTRNEDSF